MEIEGLITTQIINAIELDANDQSLWYFENKGDIGILEYYSYYYKDEDKEKGINRLLATTITCYTGGKKSTFTLPFDDETAERWQLVFRELQGGILALLLTGDKSLDQISYKTIAALYYYPNNNVELPPLKIDIINKLEPKSWKTNVGYTIMYPSVYRIGSTSHNTLPVILSYGGIRLEHQIGLLKIDTAASQALWQTTRHDEFATLNDGDRLQFQGHEFDEEDMERYYSETLTDDGYSNYFDHYHQLLWRDVWCVSNVLCGFSCGTSRTKRYKGWEDVLFVRLVNKDSKFELYDILYEIEAKEAYDDDSYPPMMVIWNLSSIICLFQIYRKTAKEKLTIWAYNLVEGKFYEIEQPEGKTKYDPIVIIGNKIVFGKYIARTKKTSLIITRMIVTDQ